MLTPERALALGQMGIESLGGEMQTTAKVIAAIPEGKKEWQPDPKAKSGVELAWHIASSEVQMLDEIADMKFTMEEKAKEKPTSIDGILAWYRQEFPRAAARVGAMTGEQLATPVDFYGAFNFPVVMYLGFVEKHSIHHRGQLSTYLRPMGSKVPAIYGGSADEPFQAG
jgi:uncharacterized damage-inducible protein DinB